MTELGLDGNKYNLLLRLFMQQPHMLVAPKGAIKKAELSSTIAICLTDAKKRNFISMESIN